ncbi:hypothetical protein AX16_001282 [Volvariella volvacea WC 439]|nr:hypothetical protein AX16_001282 [Volvariella volvacea WC 439]
MHRVVAIQFWSKSANKRGEEALRKAGISAHAFFPNVLSCTNLDPELPEEDAVALLQQLFSPYEEIMRVQIFTREDVAEDCTCTGLIELKSLKQAQLAISELDGSSLNGRQITVRFWECQNPVKTQKLAKVDAEKGSSSAVLSTGDDGHTKMSTTEDDLVSNERTPPLALAEKYCSDQYISYPLTPPLSPIDSVNIPSSPSSNCSTSAPPPSPCSENIDPPTLDVTPTLNVGPPRIQFGTVNATRVNVLRALTRGVTQDTPVLFRRLAGRKHNAQIEDQSLKKDYLPVLVKSAILTPDIPEKCTSVGPTTQTSKKTDRSDIKFDYTSQTALIEAKSSRGDEKRQLIATVSVPWRSRDRIQGVGEAKVGPTEVKPMRRWSDDWDEDEGLPPLPVEWLQAYRCEIR